MAADASPLVTREEAIRGLEAARTFWRSELGRFGKCPEVSVRKLAWLYEDAHEETDHVLQEMLMAVEAPKEPK